MLHKMGEDVGVIGICGVGGIGKTTLAKEVYKQKRSRFGSRCFLSDVKEAKGVAVTDLQMKMVTDLLGGLKSLLVFNARKTVVEELPESFGLLQGLKEVDFGDCWQLLKLNENFGCLGTLLMVNLEGYERLTKLPDSFSDLSSLEELQLNKCWVLRALPPFSALKRLRKLDMGYTAVEEIPEEFGQLQNLTEVDLRWYKQLQSLCGNFGCLGNLQKVDLRCCVSLTRLPDSFSNLSNLEELDLSSCTLDEKFPPSIYKLKKLRKFQMEGTANGNTWRGLWTSSNSCSC